MAEKKFELKFAASTTGSEQLAKLSRAVEDIGTQSQSTAKLLEKVAQSSIDSNRQFEALARSAQQLERALASSVADNSKKFDQLAESAKRLQEAMSKVSGSRSQGFAGIATDADGASTAIIGLTGSFGALVAKAGAVKFVADQFLAINRNILETQAQVDKLTNILSVKNDGNLDLVKRDLVLLEQLSERLGLRFGETATAFAKISVAAKGSSLEGKGAREVFEAVSASMAKVGVSGDGANRVFLALQQIISKGTVQTEELKGQLGEQIPGAMNIAARAVGVTTAEFAKMLEQGQVVSSDFLPKFAAEMKRTFQIDSTTSVDTATAALNRFDNSIERLQKSLAEKLAPAAASTLSQISTALDFLSFQVKTTELSFTGLFDSMTRVLSYVPGSGGQMIASTVEGRKKQREELNKALEQAQSDQNSGGFFKRGTAARDIEEIKSILAQMDKLDAGRTGDEMDEILTTLISQGRQQAENFRQLESGYKAQGDAIKGINKDYEIQIKLAKDARAAGLINDTQLKTRLAEIEGKYGAKNDSAQKAEEAARAFANLNDKISKVAATEAQKIISGEKLNEFLRLSIDLTNEVNSANSKLNADQKAQIMLIAEAMKAKGEAIAQMEIERDLIEQSAKETAKRGEEINKTIEAINRENESLREKISTVGLTNEQAAEAINLRDQERVATLEQTLANYDLSDSYDLTRISAEKELDALRERIRLRKELGAKRDAQEAADSQQRLLDQVTRELSRGITDSIFRGFEGGKKFISSFKDAIKNAFKSFIVKFAVQPIIGSVIGGIAGSLGFSGLAQAATKELGSFGGFGGASGGSGSTAGGSSGGVGLSDVSGAKTLYDAFAGGIAGISGAVTTGINNLGAYLATSNNNLAASVGDYIVSGSTNAGGGVAGAAGSAAGFAASAGTVYAGYQVGRGISNGFSLNGGTGNGTVNAGAAIGAVVGSIVPVIGTAVGAALGAAIGGVVNRTLGKKVTQSLGASGIEGTFGQGGFSGSTFQDITTTTKKGILRGGGSSSSTFTEYGQIPTEALEQLSDSFDALTESAKASGLILGRNLTAALSAVRVSGRFSIGTQDEFKATLDRLSDEIIRQTIPAVEQFREAGENLVTTAGRIATATATANNTAILLGNSARFSIDNAKSALSFGQRLQDQVGQLESVLAQFVPASVLARRQVAAFQKTLENLGLEATITTDTTREQFADLLEQIDLTSEAGQRELEVLLSIAPALSQVIAVRDAEDLALEQTKKTLDRMIDSVSGTTNAFVDADEAINQTRLALFDTTDIQNRLGLETQLGQQIVARYELEMQLLGALQASLSELQVNTGGERGATQGAIADILGTPLLRTATQISKAVKGAAASANLPALDGINAATQKVADQEKKLLEIGDAKSKLTGAKSVLNSSVVDAKRYLSDLDSRLKERGDLLLTAKQAESKQTAASAFSRLGAGIGELLRFDDAKRRIVVNSGLNNPNSVEELTSSIVVKLFKQFSPGLPEGIYTGINTVSPNSNIAIDKAESEVKRLEGIISGSGSASDALKKAQEELAKQNKLFADAIQEFVIDAGKAVSKLSKLREETVAYFQAQKALADLYNSSAAQLRNTVAGVRFSKLTEAQQLDQLRGQFDTAVLLSKSLTGDALVSQADKINSLIDPLLQLAFQLTPNGDSFTKLEASILSQAEGVASRLEDLAPKNFQEESVKLLGQIDTQLALIEANTATAEKLIVDAINISRDRTLEGLRSVVAAVRGDEVPAFATGGMFAGGMRLVGERGPELEVTGPSRIFSATQTRNILSGSGNSEMAAEIRALRQEVSQLRAENRAGQTAIAANTGKAARVLERADNGEGLNIMMVTE